MAFMQLLRFRLVPPDNETPKHLSGSKGVNGVRVAYSAGCPGNKQDAPRDPARFHVKKCLPFPGFSAIRPAEYKVIAIRAA